MVNMAQRIEALRTERGMSRGALSTALGFPKGAFDKFETGRQTPSKEQQESIAAYFGVSLFYLKGESNDRTRQDGWMDAANDVAPPDVPIASQKPKPVGEPQGALLDSLLATRQVQELLRTIVLDTLKSSEGQALIAKAAAKELLKRGL